MPHQSPSVGIEPLKLADNSLKCPVYLRIYADSSNNGLAIRNETLKATELIELAHKSKPFHLKLFKNDLDNASDSNSVEDSLEFYFLPNLDLLGQKLRDLPSSSFNNGTICHYEAFDSNGFHNALSACSIENFVALIRIHGHQYILEYDQDNSLFFLIPQSTKSCEWPKLRPKRYLPTGSVPTTNSIPTKIPSYYAQYLDDIKRHIELILIADNSMYKKYGNNETKVHDRLEAIASIANSLYASLNIRITLVWIDVWKTKDEILISESGADKILSDFMNYRKTIKHSNDNAHLITDKRFNQVVGKAYKGTICSYDHSGGVIVDHDNNAVFVGATLAHEMGHNLGMEHDSGYPKPCKCEGSESCIMAPTGSYNIENFFFSTCSLDFLQSGFKHQLDYCLHNVPKKSFGGARCGNGILEEGEECDCGSATHCPNKCCVASTCRLAPEAKCADGECCDINICMPKAAASVCRSSTNSCDLPEYCDGRNPQCPADFFVQNGHPCPNSKDDFCYDGICGNRDQQCKFIWGPTGENSVPECYSYNTQRGIIGNCGYDADTNTYLACAPENIECGRLQCRHLSEKPIFGDSTVVQTAYSFVRLSSGTDAACRVIKTSYKGGKREPDPGMVQDGAKCGKNNDKMCLKAECRNRSDVLQQVSKCEPENCNNKGICNNVGNCHCENGYGGVGCDIPGYGGSLNSGPAQTDTFNPGLVLLYILLAGIVIFAIATFYFKRNHKFWLHKKIWCILRDKLHIRSINVPIRKAPPPPGTKIQHPHRFSFNALWGGDRTSTVVVAKTPESPTNGMFIPPLPGIKITPNPAPQKIGFPKNLPIYDPPILDKTPKKYQWPPYSNNTSNSESGTAIRPLKSPPPIPPPHRNMAAKNQKKEPKNNLILQNIDSKPITKVKPKLPVKPPVAIKSIITTSERDNPSNTSLSVKEMAARFNTPP